MLRRFGIEVSKVGQKTHLTKSYHVSAVCNKWHEDPCSRRYEHKKANDGKSFWQEFANGIKQLQQFAKEVENINIKNIPGTGMQGSGFRRFDLKGISELHYNEETFTVKFDVTGLEMDNLHLKVQDDCLLLTGDKNINRYLFVIPENIDGDSFESSLTNNVLTISGNVVSKDEKERVVPIQR